MSNLDEVINYLHDNYYNDCERMAHIKMIAAIANSDSLPFSPSIIDKCALFNNIIKSYPPKQSVSLKVAKGIQKIGSIFYG